LSPQETESHRRENGALGKNAFGAIGSNGDAYAMGGGDSSFYLEVCEKWDAHAQMWTPIANMSKKHFGTAAAEYKVKWDLLNMPIYISLSGYKSFVFLS
jgi:hypothetical protein